MKRWPYGATESELITLFTARGAVGAQVYDADRTGPEWNESGKRLVTLLDGAKRYNASVDSEHLKVSDPRAREEEYAATFALVEREHAELLRRAYTSRRAGNDKLMSVFNAHTPEGMRHLNILPFCACAIATYKKDVEREAELLLRKLDKDTRPIKWPDDPDAARALRTKFGRRMDVIVDLARSLEAGPTHGQMYAHFERIATSQRLDENGYRRNVDKRIAEVERESDRIVEPALESYEVLRRRRELLKQRRRKAVVESIRGGES